MMSLLDEHKEEVSEASYVEMCNALKYLHNQCTANQNRVPAPPHQRSPTQIRIAENERLIRTLQAQLRSRRVTNQDKVNALESLLQSHSIAFRPAPEITNMRVNELHAIVLQHPETFREVIPNLSRIYQEKRDARVETVHARIRERIQNLQFSVAALRNINA